MMQSDKKQIQISLFLVLAASLIVSLGFLDPINWPKQIGLFIAASYSAFQALVHSISTRDPSLRKISFFILLSLSCFTIPWFVVRVDVSRFLWGTFGRNNGFITNFSLFLLAIAAALFVRNGLSTLTFLRFCALCTSMAGIYGFIQFLGLDWVAWSKQNEVFSLYGNSNFASAAFAIGAISSLLLFLEYLNARRPQLALLYVFIFVLLGFITYETNSIQGIFGMTIGIVLTVITSVYNRSRKAGWSLTAAAIVFGILILFGFYGLGPLGQYIYQYTLNLRFEYWMAAIRMFKDHLFFGVGYDSYGDFFQKYRSDSVAIETGVGLTTNNAHNPFLQTLSTIGLVGALPLIICFVFALILCLKYLVRTEKTRSRLSDQKYAAILFASAWSMAFFSIDNISVAILNWFLLGMILGYVKEKGVAPETLNGAHGRNRKVPSTTRNPLIVYRSGISVLIVGLVFAISWASSLPNRSLARTFANNQVNNSDPNWLNDRQASLLKVTENPMTRETEFRWAAEGFYNLGLEDATIKTLVIGLRKFPRDMTLLDNLAFVLEKKSDFRTALDIRKRQLRIETRNWRIYYFVALDLKNSGNIVDANSYIKKIPGLFKFMTPEEKMEYERISVEFAK